MQFSFYIVAIILSVVLNALPAAAKKQNSNGYVTIPVYYITDRAKDKDTFSGRRRYIINCQHEMYFGVTYVTVPNEAGYVAGKEFDRLGWKFTQEKAAKIFPKDCIDPADYAKAKATFFNLITQALDKSGDDKLCLFVHGANDPFEDASVDAASLAYYMQYPQVLYTWPSVPKLLGYTADNANNEWSQKHFNMTCKDFMNFAEKHPLHITLVAHSMGNRIVARATGNLAGTKLVNDVELVSPDIDAETFKHYIMDYHQGDVEARLYTSAKDRMLPLSQILAGGYYRLGEGVDAIFPKHDKLDTGDGVNPPVVNTKRAQRINFTLLDKGFSGHTMPNQLVASMVHTGKPGDGLALVPAKIFEGNRMTRRAARKFGLTEKDEEDSGLGLQVIRVKQDKK